MVEPKWVQEEMAKQPTGKPITRRMQKKMNGTTPEKKKHA